MRFAILTIGALATLAAMPAQARDAQPAPAAANTAPAKKCEVRNIHFLGKLAKVEKRVHCTQATEIAAADTKATNLPSPTAR